MARILANKTNVDAPTGSYPYGKIRDRAGITPGTPGSEEVYGDFHQFFARLLAFSKTTPNDLPENALNGFQFIESLVKLFAPDSISSASYYDYIVDFSGFSGDTSILGGNDSISTSTSGLIYTKIGLFAGEKIRFGGNITGNDSSSIIFGLRGISENSGLVEDYPYSLKKTESALGVFSTEFFIERSGLYEFFIETDIGVGIDVDSLKIERIYG